MVVETTEMAVQSAVIFSTLRRSPFGTFRQHSVRPFLPSNFSGKHPSTTEVLRIGPNAKLLHIAAEAGDNGGRIDGKQSGRSGDTVNIEDSTE